MGPPEEVVEGQTAPAPEHNDLLVDDVLVDLQHEGGVVG